MLTLPTAHSGDFGTHLMSFMLPLTMTSLFAVVTSSCPFSMGATKDLRTVVTGKCIQYTSTINPRPFCGRSKGVNCSEVADSFIQAFAYQDPCQVNMTRYDEFLSLTRHDIADGKFQFWSDVYDIILKYSQGGKRKMTLEDTLSGYLLSGLRFCSSPGEPGGIGGPSTTDCPAYHQTEGCPWDAEASFWIAASKNFATKARGVISVMLNASLEEAFWNSSYFAEWELPNIEGDVITRIDIILAHRPDGVVRHTCESDNIKALKSLLNARSIAHTCKSNPRNLLWLLCWDHGDKQECRNFASTGGGSTVTMATTAFLPMRWMFSLIFIMCHIL